MNFSLPSPSVADSGQQINNEALLRGLNQIAQFLFSGTGVPTFNPGGPALYFREDFGVNSSVYVYDGTWKSVT